MRARSSLSTSSLRCRPSKSGKGGHRRSSDPDGTGTTKGQCDAPAVLFAGRVTPIPLLERARKPAPTLARSEPRPGEAAAALSFRQNGHAGLVGIVTAEFGSIVSPIPLRNDDDAGRVEIAAAGRGLSFRRIGLTLDDPCHECHGDDGEENLRIAISHGTPHPNRLHKYALTTYSERKGGAGIKKGRR